MIQNTVQKVLEEKSRIYNHIWGKWREQMGNPLRVLHVVVNMNRGGAETLLMNLYRNIDRSKIQFDFLTCKEGVFDNEIIEMGGKIHRIPYIQM